MAETFKYDVFISHSSHDKPAARELAERLRKDGLRVWPGVFDDDWEIKPGDAILLKIQEGLEQSRTLVLVMSEHASASEWVTFEHHSVLFRDLSAGANQKRRFIPVRLDDAEIRDALKQFAYVDWRQRSEEQYARLLAACLPLAEQQARYGLGTTMVEKQLRAQGKERRFQQQVSQRELEAQQLRAEDKAGQQAEVQQHKLIALWQPEEVARPVTEHNVLVEKYHQLQAEWQHLTTPLNKLEKQQQEEETVPHPTITSVRSSRKLGVGLVLAAVIVAGLLYWLWSQQQPSVPEIEMVFVNGGTFLMGSPENEPGRSDNEGPQRHVEYWTAQEYLVMLVIRTSDGQIRGMNVTEYLKKQSKAVKQIVFDGEPFTAASLWRMRDRVLGV